MFKELIFDYYWLIKTKKNAKAVLSMNKLELLEIINNGENSYIEFKEESIKPKDLAEEIVAFANSEGGSIHYDISPVLGTSIKDLNLDIIRDYFLKYNTFDLYEEDKSSTARILVNADILKEVDNQLVCSVEGLLIFGKKPEMILPQNGISFAHFCGNQITDDLIDKKNINGRLQDIAEQTLVVI